ncbi:hypothetical protein V8E53_007488 [Lactarius tabidus]
MPWQALSMLCPGFVITAVNALVNAVRQLRRIPSEVGQRSRSQVMQKIGRTVTLFGWPHIQTDRGEIEQHAKIETLPDEILLEIFDCVRLAQAASAISKGLDCVIRHQLVLPSSSSNWGSWKWHRLIHVCRMWRCLVFASLNRLDLLLVYTHERKARVMKKVLASWQTLPIAVRYPRRYRWHYGTEESLILEDQNNASFALQHHPNLIREIDLFLTKPLFLKVGPQLLASFPAIEYLRLESWNQTESPTLPAGFLGKSAPRLRHLLLIGVAFPTFPLQLLSARDLVFLQLGFVSRSAYISPETLSIGLSATTRLKCLVIEFPPIGSNFFSETGSVGRSLTATAILPALTKFHFDGDNAYLEDLISRIDSPILKRLFKPSAFGTRQLSQFTCRPNSLWLVPTEIDPQVTLPYCIKQLSERRSSVSRLDMKSVLPCQWSPPWLYPNEMDPSLWVNFFCSLERVTALEVAGVFVQIIGSVLEQLPGEMVRRVLPALKDLHIGRCETAGPFEKFVNARRSSGCPLTVQYAMAQPAAKPHLNEWRYRLSVEP